MYDENADKAAVISVLSGNSEAYGDIVHRYKDIIFKVIDAIVKNYHTAQDLTQDTFIDGYVKLKSLEEPCKIGAWLVKIAKNKCYNHLTRSASRHESELHDYIPDVRASSPENLMVEQHERQMVRQAVGRLPDLHKTVAVLYYYDNYSHEKISELLNIPVGTVKSRLNSARAKLKKEIEKMNNTDNTILDKDFEKQVAEKVKTIQNYYDLHNNSFDGFENEFRKTVELIDRLPDSQEKHAAYADVYLVASYQNKTHRDRALKEAELGDRAQIMADITIGEYLNDDYDRFIAKIDETLPKMRKMTENLFNNDAIGKLLFWRGSRRFIQGWDNDDTAKLNEAKADFIEAEKKLKKENSYHPNAIAGIKAVDIELADMGKYAKCSYGICGEQLIYHDNKLLFGQQPGFSRSMSHINRCDGIFFYVSSIFSRTFFDENMEIGEAHSITGEKGSTLTLVSKNAKISTRAGEFENCLHTKLHAIWYFNYDADVYYAKGVGIVKAEFALEQAVENYELCEYKINEGNVGSEYMPFAAGNMWRYVNTNLPAIYQHQIIEKELISVHRREDGAVYANFSAVEYLRMKKINRFADDCDSETYIMLADMALPYEKPNEWDFASAIKYLKYAIRANSNERAALYALHTVDYMTKIKEYLDVKKYRFLPSHNYGSFVTKKDGKTAYKENGSRYETSPYRWSSRHEENKIFGMKPFRYLRQLAGTLYSDKWIAGYTEQIKHDDGDISLKVEDGKTVTVKAGTFENCIKVTFDLPLPNDSEYFKDFKYTHCGKKIYYYAPNVGIVRHECVWGDSLSSVCELTEYKSVATDGEYMPVYIGNRWIYDEMTLEPGYRARKKYDIVLGMNDEFFMIDEQEFLYLGTEEEYEEFKKSLKK